MHADLATRLYEALLAGDPETFRGGLDEDSTWELPGRSALAGMHRGPEAIVAILHRLTGLRPIRPDAFDVAASEHHAVLMTRLVSERLDSDHAIIVVARDGDRLDRAFHYVFDMYAFDAFFSTQ